MLPATPTLTGRTTSTDFPTEQPLQGANAGGVFDAFVAKIALAISIDIDIKPRKDLNAINPAHSEVIPVAILTTDTFDAGTVSLDILLFGPDGATIAHPSGHVDDVDGDGDLDLLLHFRTQETGIQCGDIEASLSGVTIDGQAIQGTDSLVTRGCS